MRGTVRAVCRQAASVSRQLSSRCMMSTSTSAQAVVHPMAVVSPHAVVRDGVKVGPFCVVEEGAVLGAGVELQSHVVVSNNTQIGDNTVVHPFTVLGGSPQDLKYRGEPSTLIIGANCVIREHVTINIGTSGGGGVTRVGNGVLIMCGVHIGHDCHVEDKAILSSGATLAGHVFVGTQAIIGGGAAVMQFVRIGTGAMIGGQSALVGDVIPYGVAAGNRACLIGVNLVGLKRRNVPRAQRWKLLQAYRYLFSAPNGAFQGNPTALGLPLHPKEGLLDRASRLRATIEMGGMGDGSDGGGADQYVRQMIEFALDRGTVTQGSGVGTRRQPLCTPTTAKHTHEHTHEHYGD